MKTEARVLDKTGVQHKAVFESVMIEDQLWLVLDRGADPDIKPVLFRPRQEALIPVSERGLSYLYLESLVPVEKYNDLPPERTGFAWID